MRRRRRRHRRRAVGLRGRPVRRRRHLRLVRRQPGPARPTREARRAPGIGVHELPHRAGRRAGRSASTAWSPSTGTAATARCSSTTSSPAWSSARPWPPAPRTSTARCSRPRRSAPGSIVETFEASGVPVTEFVVAGGLLKNALLMQIYADVLDLPLSTIDSEPGPGARLGDPRRRRRRRLPRRPRRRRARWAGVEPAASTRPIADNVAAYDELYAEYRALHDHFGRGAQRRDAPRSRRSVGEAARVMPRHRSRRRARHDRRPARRGGRAARRADPLRLVVWTAGNVSARVPGPDLHGHQAVGVSYDELDRRTRWSSATSTATSSRATARRPRDTAAHAYVYRHMPEVGGVVHTHSTYATAWAARGEPIPCVLTMMADEFGGEIPVGPFALIGDDSIGRGIVETLRGSRSPAVLMRNHGPFTVGKDARAAVKAAVMCRGRRPHRAHRPPARRAGRRSRRPTSTRSTTATRTSTARQPARSRHVTEPTRSGSSPAARASTARGRSTRSPRSRSEIVRRAGRAPTTSPVRGRREAGAHRRRRHPPGAARRRTPTTACVGVIAWMHTFSPGEDVDHRARRAAQAAAAPAHPGQPGAAVGRDRHGLHEPQPGRPRRPGVRRTSRPGSASPARPSPGTSSDPRRRSRGSAPGRAPRSAAPSCARCGWPASATTCATSRSPRATRSRPSCRFGVSVNTYGVNDLVGGRRRGRRRRRRRAGRRVRRHLRRRARAAARRRAARVAALRRPHRGWACARSSTDGGFTAFTTNFEDLGGLRQLPGLAVQRLMADGYGFGGEGDWKTSVHAAHPQGRWPPGCPAARRSWRTTPTTWSPARRRSSARTCSRSARPSPAARPTLRDPPARHRRPRGPGPAGLRRRPRRRPWSSASRDLGDRFRLVANEVDGRRPRRAAAEAARSPAPSGSPKPDLAHLGRGLADGRRTAPHRAVDRAHRPSTSTTSPRSLGTELVAHRRRHHRPRASATSCAGTRPTTDWPEGSDPGAGPRARHRAVRGTDGRRPPASKKKENHHDAQDPCGRRQCGLALRPARRAAATTTGAGSAASAGNPADITSASPCRPRPPSAGSSRRRQHQGAARGCRLQGQPPVRRTTTSRPRSPSSRT